MMDVKLLLNPKTDLPRREEATDTSGSKGNERSIDKRFTCQICGKRVTDVKRHGKIDIEFI
jgi:hypothetical protein